MHRLRQIERERAIGMLAAGMTEVKVTNHLNVSRMTFARLKTRLRDTDTTNDRPCSGRPRETTLRQDKHIRIIHLRNRFINASQTARQTHGRHNNRISAQWTRVRIRWIRQTWRQVLFTDESKFNVIAGDITEYEEFDILAFTESWLNCSHTDDSINLLNFQSFSSRQGPSKTGRGVVVYVKNNLNVRRRPDLEIDELEAMLLELKVQNKNILFCTFYIPPNSGHETWDKVETSLKL
ncbi:Hypothetical predicted protein [Mytilus galloprovincialis]|uniref:Uncharacterized protein n=1 Tax=Mytilus galloprovincialis TaxID=29158 RepID=A0A8B6G3Y2_MYTGA|nr:Hypothetical predicted protein [Mytilus galloprovincialis]